MYIVIPSYNAPHKLEALLKDLSAYNLDTIVVENSTPEYQEKCLEVCKKFPFVMPLSFPGPLGFTEAVNHGLKWGGVQDVWLLNQDCRLIGDPITPLTTFMASNPKAGIISSILLDMNCHSKVVFGGGLSILRGQHKTGLVQFFQKPTKESWVTFGSVYLRREMIREVGLLDKKMRMIFSDSDYCLRARYAGWEVWVEPKSKVAHLEEEGFSRASNPDKSKERLWILQRDSFYFHLKWANSLIFADLENEVLEE